MAEKFPVDEFDRVSAVGGRHRKQVSRGSKLFAGIGYLGVAAVLGGAGYYGLEAASQLSQQPGSSQQVASRYVAGGASVTVLDASGRKSLATDLAQKLAAEKWNVLTAADLINESDPTLVNDKTQIFANSESNLSIAKTLAKLVGNFEVEQSSTYPDDITVVLGTDFSQ